MKALLRTGLLGVCWLAGCLAGSAAGGKDQVPWATDFRTACALAAEQQRLVLLHFTQDNCPPCRKVEADVFSQPSVAETVALNYLPVQVHKDKNPQLVSRYQVKQFPTDVFVTPSGLEVYHAISPQQPADYIALLNRVAKQTGTSASRQWAATMGPLAAQAAEQPAAIGQQFQQHVVGAAEEMQQQAAIVANSAEQKVAATAEQFQQQAGAFNQQAQNTREQFQQAGQQSLAAARGAAQSWQQSLSGMQTNMRSAFNPGAALGAPPLDVPPPGSASVPNPAAATAPNNPPPVVQQQPQLPTANPWLTPEGRAVLAEQAPKAPALQSTAPPLETAPPLAAATVPSIPERTTADAVTSAPLAMANSQPGATPASTPPGSSQMVAASQAPPIAIDGFCVVTLIETKSWKKSDPKFGAIHRGRTYLFTSEANQKKFLANPDAFAPVLSGCDPVRFARTGELVDGKRAYGLITQDNHIYLFADEAGLQTFEKSPGEFAAAAQQAMLRGVSNNIYR